MWPFSTAYPLKRLEDVSGQTYDYIVVGGGTAGSAVASRLSETPNTTVLVLERGPFQDSYISRIPLASTANGSYAVRRDCDPDSQTDNRALDVLSAETLGGNSRINAMIYTRGAPAYYENWARSHPDWSWADVEPYFRKVEKIIPLRQNHEPVSGIYTHLQKSAGALGLAAEQSANRLDAPAMGYFNLDLAIDSSGYRKSAFHAYLSKELAVRRQATLHICTDVVVSHLDLNPSQGVVRGVFVQKAGQEQKRLDPTFIKAKREVILAGGAICTPQILQLSGLGPRSLLESFGITVVRDLPGVGTHLGDHNLFPVFVEVPAQDSLQQLVDSPLQMLKHFLLFATAGQGWLKSTLDRAIFFNTTHIDRETCTLRATDATLDARNSENFPDIELMIVPVGTLPELYPGKSLFTIQVSLNQPKSMGIVKIKSSDPKDSPNIQLNILSDARDREVARKALRFSLHLAEQFVQHSGYPYKARLFGGPGGSDSKKSDWRSISDDELDKYMRKYIMSVYHLTSSCRMASEEEEGVVDNRLRVHGFKNLRIADASVLPSVAPAHPMAPTYMVAERCADFLKEDWS